MNATAEALVRDVGMEKETGDRRPATGNRQPAMEKGANIAARLVRFGVATVHLGARLPRNPAGRHISIQLVRSGTGAGSNYDEGRAAESRADFIHKVSIAAKEMREACYWVDLVAETGWVNDDLRAMRQEARELAAILGASVRTARLRQEHKGK